MIKNESVYPEAEEINRRYINIFMLPVIHAKIFFSSTIDKDDFRYCLRTN